MRQRHFFYIPFADRRAFLVVLLVVAIAGGVIWLFDRNIAPTQNVVDSTDSIPSGNMAEEVGNSHHTFIYDEGYDRVIELFPFDPNKADSTKLLRLGLSKFIVRNIYRFRNKGGVFRDKASFSRLYGLTEQEYRRLEPYIKISPEYQQAKPRYASKEYETFEQMQAEHQGDPTKHQPKLQQGQTIALNQSDTTAMKQVPGIGSYFAQKIVNYRERLGGFVSANQLAEIKNFPDDAIDYFRTDHQPVRQINVNKMTIDQMRRHPYITFSQAKAISDYRRLKGKIRSIEDLRLMKEFTADDILRLTPYLSY